MKETSIKIRVTSSIKNTLKEKAKKREVTLTEYLLKRALINKDLTLEEKTNLKSLLYHTQKIGINLNQLAKKVNSSSLTLSSNTYNVHNIITQIKEIQTNNCNIINFIKKLL